MKPLYESTSEFLYASTKLGPKIEPVTCKNFSKAFPWEENAKWVAQESELDLDLGNWLWKIERLYHVNDLKNARFIHLTKL